MNRQVRTPWTISSWPTMTLEISDFTWLYRVRNSSARASIDSEGARDIDGDPFVTVGDVLELHGFPRPEPEYRPPPADALSCRNAVELAITPLVEGTSGSLSPRGRGLG